MLILLLLAALFFSHSPHYAVAALSGSEAAQTEKTPEDKTEKAKASAARQATTRHSIAAGGISLSYTATAGELPLVNAAGETEANVFFTAYQVEPKGATPRPLMFAFNGGPGAASVWLHLGTMGPRRVEMLPDGSMPPPPFHLVDNPFTWLDRADLVFVDPVGTGFSRAVKPDDTKRFTSVGADIDAMGRFITLYLSRNARWSSPLFLVGESYGSFRVAGLSEYLADHGVALNGVLLISSVLNMQTISFNNGNDLPYQLYLPSYAATAWYHGRLAPQLQENLERTLAEAEAWADAEYLPALNKGSRLKPAEREAVKAKLARYTGLAPAFIESHNLRIDSRNFTKELLRDRKLLLGHMESRFTVPDPDAAGPFFDATVPHIRPPFSSTYNQYVRQELGYQTDLEYFTLGGGIGHWDWEAKNSYADTSDNLRNSMAKNRYLKLFVASGYFDLATPYYATEYTLAHLGLPSELQGNITQKRFPAGHMMYLEQNSLAELKREVDAFIKDACRSRR